MSLRHSGRLEISHYRCCVALLVCGGVPVCSLARECSCADPLWLAACVHAWQVCPGHCLAMVGLVLPLAPGLVLGCEATRATAVCACLLQQQLDASWLVRLCSC